MYKELVHKADLQNGYYMNPILDGDYPDPAVMRENADFYLCATTGQCMPGLTIYHSTDLVNWEFLCNPLNNFEYSVCAPDIFKYKDIYYIYFCAKGSNWVIYSDCINQGWSKPIDLKVGHIDPGHCVDEGGKRLLFLSENYIVPLSDDGLSVIGEMKQVLKAPEIPIDWDVEGYYPEAPNVFKKDGYYYLTYANGGTTGPATSHMVMCARAKSPYGPWEMSPYNPIVHTYSREEKWSSKGHGHIVDDTDGNWWMIYHAYEKGLYTAGRKLLLSPLEFTNDGWFKVTAKAEEATKKPAGKRQDNAMSFSDLFCDENKDMPCQWHTLGNIDQNRFSRTKNGLYVIAADAKVGYSNPFLINTGDRCFEISVDCSIEKGCQAGLIAIYNEEIFDGISMSESGLSIYRYGKVLVNKEMSLSSCRLKIKIDDGYLSCWYSMDGKEFSKLNYVIDISARSPLAYNGFGGLRYGLFAVGKNHALFKNFKYVGLK